MGETTAARNGHSLDSPEATTDLDEPPSAIRPPSAVPPPHSLSPPDLARVLDSDPRNGLSSAEAAARLERDGPNRVEAAKGTSAWQIFLRQISNSLTLVLVIVMVLSFSIQDYIEASVVAAVILFNIVVGYACILHTSRGRCSLKDRRAAAPVDLCYCCLPITFSYLVALPLLRDSARHPS